MPAFKASIAPDTEVITDTKEAASSTRRYKSPAMVTMRVLVLVTVMLLVVRVPVLVTVMLLVVVELKDVVLTVVVIVVVVTVVVITRHCGKLPSRLPDLLQLMVSGKPE